MGVIYHYLMKWGLKMSIAKTVSTMFTHRKNMMVNCKLKVQLAVFFFRVDSILTKTPRYLGVKLNHSLTNKINVTVKANPLGFYDSCHSKAPR